MELLTDFFSNEYKTGKHNLPSIKNYIDSLKMSSYDSYEDSLKYILSNIPENCKKTFFDTLHHINPSHMKFLMVGMLYVVDILLHIMQNFMEVILKLLLNSDFYMILENHFAKLL